MNNFHHYAKSHNQGNLGISGVSISDFKLLNQLEVGDKIQVKSDRWLTITQTATIVGFNHPSDSYPISIVYDNKLPVGWRSATDFKLNNGKYDIPLGWIHINESVIRDIKINRIL